MKLTLRTLVQKWRAGKLTGFLLWFALVCQAMTLFGWVSRSMIEGKILEQQSRSKSQSSPTGERYEQIVPHEMSTLQLQLYALQQFLSSSALSQPIQPPKGSHILSRGVGFDSGSYVLPRIVSHLSRGGDS